MIEFNEELVNKYDKMIWKFARKIKSGSGDVFWRIDVEDLHSVGIEALYDASVMYKEDKGTKFITYAYTAIQNAMNKYVRENARPFKINQIQNKKIVDICALKKEGLSEDEISKKLKLPLDDVLLYLNINNFAYSLDFEIDDGDGKKMDIGEVICKNDSGDAAKAVSFLETAFENVRSLTPTEKEIYYHYKGIFGREKMSKKDLRSYFKIKCSDFDEELKKICLRMERAIVSANEQLEMYKDNVDRYR